jgi:hypothetical protein
VTEWIRRNDLQVTSRERNPQFCGSPSRLRDRGFYAIQPDGKLYHMSRYLKFNTQKHEFLNQCTHSTSYRGAGYGNFCEEKTMKYASCVNICMHLARISEMF